MQRLRSVWMATCVLAIAASLMVVVRGAELVDATAEDRGPRTATADDPAALRELAGRALGDGALSEVTFFPGRVGPFPAAGPDGKAPVPVLFPLPPGGRLVGSVARRSRESGVGGDSLEVIQDAPGTPAQILAFYQAALGAAGWRALALGPGPETAGSPDQVGQTAPIPADLRFAAFCRTAAPSWLSLTITANGPLADIHLQSAQSAAPCAGLP